MQRRLIAAVTAVLLAAVGGVLLLNYVAGADQRAMAGLQPVPVLVVTKAVPEGAGADAVADSVELRQLPADAVAPGTTADLADVAGLVTTTNLEPGEQVLISRFTDPKARAAAQGVTVPAGLQRVSVQLEPQRVVNGAVVPGATVGIFLSTKDQTQLALRKVLVTAVQGGVAPDGDGGAATREPAAAVTVTLAVDPADAAKIVYTAEHGTLWLSSEPADASTATLPVTNEKNLYS